MSINNTERLLTYGEAIFEGISQEMDRDDSVFVLGQGVDDPKGTLGTTINLHKVRREMELDNTSIVTESIHQVIQQPSGD